MYYCEAVANVRKATVGYRLL